MVKKQVGRPRPEDQKEEESKHRLEPGQKYKPECHTKGEKSAGTDLGGNNEEVGRNGVQASVLCAPRGTITPTNTSTATSQPSGPPIGNTDPISMGESIAMDSNSDPITGPNQFKEDINATNTIPKKETQTERNRQLKIGTWNVRRGLIRRELEIVNLIESEDVDVLFLAGGNRY